MPKLYDCVEIIENNNEHVILKVKKNKKFELTCLSCCFDGSEVMIQLTKGNNHICTIYREKGPPVSWKWGQEGYSLVSNTLTTCRYLIVNCITRDFKININRNRKASLLIQSLKKYVS